MSDYLNTYNKKDCCGCGACSQICPQNCITMEVDTEGFLYPNIDTSMCINCGLCNKVCPVMENTKAENNSIPEAYAAYNKNETIRENSSSGGIFTLLAENVLSNNGVIFGAAMSDDCKGVHHIVVDNKEDLALLRGSKYLQSEIGTIYTQVKKHLNSGKKVLFSGTPCQVEGLKSFLGKKYDNLFCVDFICHGVPSPKVWNSYVNYRENCAGATAQRTFFRNKKFGWKMYAVLFEFSNNTAYKQIHKMDLFMQAFLKDICLRPSCYDCAFKKLNRVSDITLADFWGCENICPEIDDDKGLSLAIIHSEVGKKYFENVVSDLVIKRVDTTEALRYNPSMTKSCIKPALRDRFMSDDVINNPECWSTYFPKPSIKTRLKMLIPNSVKRKIKAYIRK